MSHLMPLGEILASFEVDLPDIVMLRKIKTAEHEVRRYLASASRPAAPTLNVGPFPATINAGVTSTVITFLETVRSQDNLRFEGNLGEKNEPFWASIAVPATGTVTATVEIGIGPQVDERFTVAVTEDGLTVTLNTTGARSAFTINELVSYTTLFEDYVQEVIVDLVRISLNVDGLGSQSSGDYSENRLNPAAQRRSVLSRLVYGGAVSLVV